MTGMIPSARRLSQRYVLITPARNEQAFLETTINAVVAQTVPPMRWVIVSDGSTDRTAEIANAYAARYPWMTVVSRSTQDRRNFAGKVAAFEAGLAVISDLDFDLIGSLDADISFGPSYFEFLIGQFAADSQLGVAGTPFEE